MDPHKLRMLQSSTECTWCTPPALVRKLQQTFHFAWDLAADAESSICQPDSTGLGHRWLGPGSPYGEDALDVPWSDLGGYPCGFLNPPYSLTQYKQGKDAGVPVVNLRWLRIEEWARKAVVESERGFTTVAVMPYAAQTEWFRLYVMGHTRDGNSWRGHAALDYWRLSHRVSFLRADGQGAANANVNTCIVIWGPNPGFVGPWVPSGRYWSYR